MSLTSSSSSTRTACEAIQLCKLNATYQGWLYKYSNSSIFKSWKRRYFVLSDERLYIFKDNSPFCNHHAVVDLTTFRSVQKISNPRKTKHGFILRTLRRPSVFDDPAGEPQQLFELELYADDEYALNAWMGVISKLFVTMDLRAFQSPLTNFDALVQRAGNLNTRPGGSILNRLDKRRQNNPLSHSPSSSTLVSSTSTDPITMTPLGELNY
ncbi:hypothetical protein GGI25_003619 [Coemansia spiralis]|uniref:PH domain-containing protein n=2 Tax=Coemansia TaxID=4863 RepID=A0A9W8G7P9_9FUNG|nr:hypothetical protein BX070DRAFT_107060 [Coemansia spiralis]KAJ1996154.1 hypothetical protein EDC05_000044 [Coemansia umbellata]KAJ2626089.1 hypothetical protein GGI26_000173 [Coemansia sp. RSA 1358]KAJ2676232.1 hypothetical protein GGI25_003619 [Coemansia spiralis]